MKQNKTDAREVFLVDTSYTTPSEQRSLASALFGGEEGLCLVGPEQVEAGIRRLEELQKIIAGFNTGIISEVCNEMSHHLKILNDECSFLQKRVYNIHRHSDCWRDNYKNHGSKKDYQNDLSKKARNELIQEIKGFSNMLFRTIKLCEGRDPREQFTPLEINVYNHFLNSAIGLSEDMRENYIRDSSFLKNPTYIGLILGTDTKLIATAHVISYSQPVTIITRDREIETILDRIEEKEDLSDYFRTKNNQRSTPHHIGVFDENLAERTFVEYYDLDGD